MKIGVFFFNDSPFTGGGYTYEAGIFNALCKLAHESRHTFVIFSNYLKKNKPLISSGQDVLEFRSIPKLLLWRYRIYRILRALYYKVMPGGEGKKYSSNLIDRFLKSINIQMLWFPVPTAYETDLPYILTLWDLEHRLQPYFPEVSNVYIWNNREIYYSLMLRRASFIVVGTKTGQAEIERFYQVPSDRIKVLPFPTPGYVLDLKYSEDIEIHDRYDLPKDYLFYPAQFWSHKNHANLLLALKVLKEKYNLTLPMVLTGSDKGNETYVRKLVDEMNLSSQVYFLGFVSTEELIALYKNAFALTFMSFFGPDNLPPLEAFALGAPVIASNISGASEQLGNAAILVDPKSPDDIAKAIHSLYNKPEIRGELVKKGLARANKWSSDDFVRKIFSIIDDFEPIRRCWK
jgi:glycosyltransferase involved in cell wall biosynthesis